jgi:glycosyltransferase involved in cell wall biosynthesis
MHVVYLYPHFSYPEGAGIVVLETAKRLKKMGVKVSIITQSGNSEILKEYPGIHFEFVGGPLPNSFSYWIQYYGIYKRVEKILDEISPDIIFPHIFPVNYWGFLYKKHNPKIPCVWFCHEPSGFVHDFRAINGLPVPMRFFAKLSNPIMKIFDKKMVSRADYIITNSNFTATRCKIIYGITKTEIAYPGVDINEFPIAPENKESYILCVSRLDYYKRIDLVITSVFLLKKKGKTIKLIIIGDGPEKKKLMKQSEELGLSENVFFTGTIDRELLIRYYAKALCVVFPTINESFGIVPIEAQAAWTPVIASKSGGPMETIVDGETGFLIKPDSTDEMIDKILYFLQNPSMAESMGISARKYVSDKFTWEKISEKLLDVFTRFANESS